MSSRQTRVLLIAVVATACGTQGNRVTDGTGCDGSACATDSGTGIDSGSPPGDGGTADAGRDEQDAGPRDSGMADDGLGTSCSRNADCPTRLCLPLDGGAGVCTRSCSDGEPGCYPGWSCGSLSGQQVCQCAPATELCDGLDNDCNGVIDDPTPANAQCAAAMGAGTICLAGVCGRPPCTSDDDCQLGDRCDLGSGICRPLEAHIQICLVASDGQGVIDGSCSPPSATLPGIDFGTIQNGTIITRRIRITNQGLGNLTLTGIHIDSTNPVFSYVGPASPTVSSAQWIDVDVSFSPAARGTENGHLLMTTNDPTRAQIDLPLTGAGGGSHAGLCVTPTPLAFGTLPVTFSRTLQLHVQNCSTGAQQLTAIALQNPSGVEVFAFGTNGPPALPVNIAVGEEIILDVVYSPSQVEAPPASDDRGTIDLRSADDSISVLLSGRGGLAACTADGGPIVPIGAVQVKNGDTTIDPATTTLTPFSLLTLDASLLAAPDGQMITSYDWRIASQPSGSRAVIGGTGSVVTFAPPLEGDYTFELVVHEGDFCQSLPITLTIHVAIQAAVYVRLTWAESYGDVDLHYVGPGGTYYADSTSNLSDLDWTHSLMTAPGAEAPTQTGQRLTDYWGLNNTCHPNGTTTDDATFDIDQRAGYGPEAVTHNRPFDGTYTVAAHYYCNGSGTTATPSIDIFVNGALVWHGTKPGMTKRQVWNAAQIVVSNNGTSITVVPLTTALFTDTHGC